LLSLLAFLEQIGEGPGILRLIAANLMPKSGQFVGESTEEVRIAVVPVRSP
jgi:hypothetical protein